MMQVRFLSDAFGMGLKMDKKQSRDHISFKENLAVARAAFRDYLMLFKEWLTDYGKVFLPIVLLGVAIVTVFFALGARDKVQAASKTLEDTFSETHATVNEVENVPFEVNMYPAVNELFSEYYLALEYSDVDAISDIQKGVTDTEIIRLEKMSEYISRYDNITVYTKPGPYYNTYIAYVYSEVYLNGRSEMTPGLQAFYVCMDEFGSFYINNLELNGEEAAYIKAISNQADVVDLKNRVNVNYSLIMEDNDSLRAYWAKVSKEIDLAVGEELALEARLKAQLVEANPTTVPEEPDTGTVVDTTAINKVRTTQSVYVRKSASTTADKLGSVAKGTVFTVIEALNNGWTKVKFEKQDGYIRNDYLEEVESANSYATATIGTITTAVLNVRGDASMTASKIGTVKLNEKVEIIQIEDGWCKIKFDGGIGYVKADYVDYQ